MKGNTMTPQFNHFHISPTRLVIIILTTIATLAACGIWYLEATPQQPQATPTPEATSTPQIYIEAGQKWEGQYEQGVGSIIPGKFPMDINIESISEDTFTGSLAFPKLRDDANGISGSIIKDIENSEDKNKWKECIKLWYPYKDKLDDGPTFIKFTETSGSELDNGTFYAIVYTDTLEGMWFTDPGAGGAQNGYYKLRL